MVKICFLAPNIYPLLTNKTNGFGGGEIELYNLAREFAKDPGFQVSVVCLTAELRMPITTENFSVIPVSPYEAQRRWRGEFFRYVFRLFLVLRKQKGDVYFGALASLESFIAFVAAFSQGKKFSFRIMHTWETDYEDLKTKIFPSAPFSNKFLPWLFIFSLKHADLLFIAREDMRRSLKENYRIEKEIVKIPNAVEDISTDYKEGQTILWLNRVHPMKNPDIFLDVAKLFPDERFVMIGSSDRGFEGLFEHIYKKARQVQNVEFIPGVPRGMVWQYHRKAKVFLLTSEAEGQSNVLIEALKTKTPVVSLHVDPDDMLMNNRMGFCAHGDFTKFVEYTKLLIENEELWRKYSENAYAFAKENFDIQKVATRYKEIFQMIAQK